MDISVVNFMGLRSGEVTVSPIALVAGMNGAGKTSLCRAVAAAVCSIPVPAVEMFGGKLVPLVKKSDVDAIIHDGFPSGSVTIEAKPGQARVSWPSCDVSSAGHPPSSSLLAAGLTIIPELSADQRTAALIELAGALPTKDDLRNALSNPDKHAGDLFDDEAIKQGMSLIDYLWSRIEVDGWDIAAKGVAEARAFVRGQWCAASGRKKWGDNIVESWRPDGWRDELYGAGAEDLADTRDALVKKWEVLIEKRGGDRSQDEINDRLAAGVPTIETEIHECGQLLAEKKSHLDKARAERDNLPEIQGASGAKCPECGTHLRPEKDKEGFLKLTRTAIGETKSREEYAAEFKKRSDLDAKINELVAATEGLDRRIDRLKDDLTCAKEAAASIADRVVDADRDREIDSAKDAADAAGKDVLIHTSYHQARAHAARAKEIDAIHSALDTGGIRETIAATKMGAFNSRLQEVCVTADWDTVTVEADMSICYGGRLYSLLSKSERYRVNATLQLAADDGSDVLVFDGIDILDRVGREGLLQAVIVSGKHALLTMTSNSPELVPDLDRANIGKSYWISDGVITSRADAVSSLRTAA